MNTCYLCKREPEYPNQPIVFTFEGEDGLFVIKTDKKDKHGLAVIVCTECQQKIIKDEIRRRVLG